MSTTVSYKGNTIATVENNTKTLKTAGKYLEGDVVLTDVSGGGSFTYTITLENTGHTGRGYVQLNGEGDKYYTAGDTIEFVKGDFLRVYAGASANCTIYVDDVVVVQTEGVQAVYDYQLPPNNVSVRFRANVVGQAWINTATLDVVSDGTYDVKGYGIANVTVGGHTATITHTVGSSYSYPYFQVNGNDPTYHKDGETFKFFDGDTLSVYLNGTMGGGALYLNGTLVRDSGLDPETYVWTPPACDLSIDIQTSGNSDIYVTTQTMNITSNGTYEIPSFGYINVNV